MGMPVVTVASGGMPVVETTNGMPVTEAANKYGIAVTKVAKYGMPVVFTTIGGGGDPSYTNVVFLAGWEGNNGAVAYVEEKTGKVATFTGNAQLSTTSPLVGTSSLLLDGTGDYITFVNSSDWNFGGGPFTVELTIRYNTVADAEYISQWDALASFCGWKLGQKSATGLTFDFYDNTAVIRTTAAAWTPLPATNYTVAVDRDSSGVVRLYVNGAFLGKMTFAQVFQTSSKALSIGRIDHGTPRYFNGRIDEIRITKGVARYASDAGYTIASFPRN